MRAGSCARSRLWTHAGERDGLGRGRGPGAEGAGRRRRRLPSLCPAARPSGVAGPAEAAAQRSLVSTNSTWRFTRGSCLTNSSFFGSFLGFFFATLRGAKKRGRGKGGGGRGGVEAESRAGGGGDGRRRAASPPAPSPIRPALGRPAHRRLGPALARRLRGDREAHALVRNALAPTRARDALKVAGARGAQKLDQHGGLFRRHGDGGALEADADGRGRRGPTDAESCACATARDARGCAGVVRGSWRPRPRARADEAERGGGGGAQRRGGGRSGKGARCRGLSPRHLAVPPRARSGAPRLRRARFARSDRAPREVRPTLLARDRAQERRRVDASGERLTESGGWRADPRRGEAIPVSGRAAERAGELRGLTERLPRERLREGPPARRPPGSRPPSDASCVALGAPSGLCDRSCEPSPALASFVALFAPLAAVGD